MRRLWAAAAAIVMCLALGGMPALAQGASGSPAVSPAPVAAGPVVVTGEESGGQFRLSDPRVSGYHTETWAGNVGLTNGFVAWGILTLRGPDGDWVGPWTVMAGYDFTRLSRLYHTLEGTEAYEGLAFVLYETTPEGWDETSPQTFEGVIYEGSAPRLEWPEPEPSPASE